MIFKKLHAGIISLLEVQLLEYSDFFFFWNSPRDCQNAPFMYLMSALNDTTSEEISCATDLRKLKIACLRHLPAGSVS